VFTCPYREGAHDIVAEYYQKIGGRPKPAKGPGRKRKSMTDPNSAPSLVSPLSPIKRRKRSPKEEAEEAAKKEEGSEESDLNWVLKAKNWEKQVDSVDTIVRDPDTDTLFAFLKWTNGKQTKVSIQSCYENCPQKVYFDFDIARVILLLTLFVSSDAQVL
jgi:chromobox protein 1